MKVNISFTSGIHIYMQYWPDLIFTKSEMAAPVWTLDNAIRFLLKAMCLQITVLLVLHGGSKKRWVNMLCLYRIYHGRSLMV